MYDSAISDKFTLLCTDLVVGRLKAPKDQAIANWIRDFHVRYLDFRMDCYIRNLDSIREIFFNMKDTISYCARLHLTWGH